MKYDAVVFDLDGTLTDSGIGITRCVAYALEKLGYPVPEQAVLDKFVGPPLYHGFIDIVHMAENDTAAGEIYYRERYNEIGWRENRLYEGIKQVLYTLKTKGCYLAVASSKPEHFVMRITKYFGIVDAFDKIVGTNSDNLNAAKDQLILSALPENPAFEKTAMVGDRKFDMMAAKRVGITAVGALYGYGSKAELLESGADQLAEKPEDLMDILI